MKQINAKVTQTNGDFIIYNSDKRIVKLLPNDPRFPVGQIHQEYIG
jgi:hypothetical protein